MLLEPVRLGSYLCTWIAELPLRPAPDTPLQRGTRIVGKRSILHEAEISRRLLLISRHVVLSSRHVLLRILPPAPTSHHALLTSQHELLATTAPGSTPICEQPLFSILRNVFSYYAYVLHHICAHPRVFPRYYLGFSL